jgi:hypothetical protein
VGQRLTFVLNLQGQNSVTTVPTPNPFRKNGRGMAPLFLVY